MAVDKLPETKWRMKILPGYCPSCEQSTALAIFYNEGKMPEGGAAAIKPMCVSCGAAWELPVPTTQMMDDEAPEPKPPRRKKRRPGRKAAPRKTVR